MRIPRPLAEALLSSEWHNHVIEFCSESTWTQEVDSLDNVRFLNRSVIPHVKKLSQFFNRKDLKNADEGLAAYWKNSSNPKNLKMAYFLMFHPANAMRVAAVASEIKRLGYSFKPKIKAIDLGTGMGAAPWGFRMALPEVKAEWTLLEQDRSTLQVADSWLRKIEVPHHAQNTKIDWSELSRAVRDKDVFDLAISSYCLNERDGRLGELADEVLNFIDRRIHAGGLFIFVEPALKLQSRRLLELRKEILAKITNDKRITARVLLPCLGHQICGAFENPEDWCHDEVVWWRPKWIQTLDRLAGLDHKTLPFSYLVIQKAKLMDAHPFSAVRQNPWRLVSPVHREGKKLEFYMCGKDGKYRSRVESTRGDTLSTLERGDLITTSSQPKSPIFELNRNTKKIDSSVD